MRRLHAICDRNIKAPLRSLVKFHRAKRSKHTYMDSAFVRLTACVCEASLRSALWVWVCPFRGTGGWDWAPSRRSPGTRQRHFAGTNSKPRKVLENAHAAKRQSHHDSPGVRPGVGCTIGERERALSAKKQRRNRSILRSGRLKSSPVGKAVETRILSQSRGALWFPITMIHPLVAGALAP